MTLNNQTSETEKVKVKINTYFVIREAVERGITYGLARAQKHTATPTRSMMETEIEKAIMFMLEGVIDWDGYGEDGNENEGEKHAN